MLSDAKLRTEYSETVVGQTAAGHPICDHSMGVRVAFPTTLTSSGEIKLLVHPSQKGAWTAFSQIMKQFDYKLFDGDGGTANCRNIKSKPFGKVSLHAYLSAIDLNPVTNTGTATDQPLAMQVALAGLRSGAGDQVFRNLTNDRMHWQINCTKASLATGITATSGAIAAPRGSRTRAVVGLSPNSEGAMDKETWMRVQEALQALKPPLYEGKKIDGRPGQDTNTAIRAFEKRMNLVQRGVLGELKDPASGLWPATRELLFVTAFAGANSAPRSAPPRSRPLGPTR